MPICAITEMNTCRIVLLAAEHARRTECKPVTAGLLCENARRATRPAGCIVSAIFSRHCAAEPGRHTVLYRDRANV